MTIKKCSGQNIWEEAKKRKQNKRTKRRWREGIENKATEINKRGWRK